MLEFFRKYQWYFFLVITIMVVISFSFFGTYNTLSTNSWGEQVAFKAINGDDITRIEMEDMTAFLSTDAADKALYGGAWGLNFLNDGVIRKDFLETGLARELVNTYQNEIKEDLDKRFEKEKKFKLYSHPQAPHINVANAWNYFMPQMNSYLTTLKNGTNPMDLDVFEARTKLYLGEKQLSSPMIKQIIRFQEQQSNGIHPDPNLDRLDLSLFGYHTMDDWFGPRFVRLVSQFIINAAILAEQKGYDVSRSEVLADLIRNTELSYKENQNNLGVASPQEYFNEQLRRLNMDQTRAIRVWRQVMLFRRYFHDVGNSVLVDNLVPQKFNEYTKQHATVDMYRLPIELRIGDYASLQTFEAYLNAVAKKTNPLDVPSTFLAVSEVKKNHPQLVQNRYLLEITQVSKKNLQSRVSLKETWSWELDEKNWAALKKEFPELGVKAAGTKDERFAALESLDSVTRGRIDYFARNSIVDSHPEWIEQALKEAEPKIEVIGLRLQGKQSPFEGLDTKEKREKLILLLDEAPVGEGPTEKLNAYTADNMTYYRIKVLEKDPQPSILTYAEAIEDDNTLDEIKDSIAEEYFDEIVKALEKTANKKEATKDELATYRFYAYLKDQKAKIEKDPAKADTIVQTIATDSEDKLEKRKPLADQWLLERKDYAVARGGRQEAPVDTNEAFALAPKAWSAVKTSANGDVIFYQMKEKGTSIAKEKAIAQQTEQAQALLSAEAQQQLMKHVLKQIEEKGAISLAYLKREPQE